MKQKNLFFMPKGKWTRMLLSLVLLMVLMTGMTFAQQKALSGKVTDESGATVPGVSVIVKGTTTGTVTDIDGKYSLNVSSTAEILSFSFVGMISQDIPIGQNSVINVVLKTETIGVEEVVVVGYGTRLKEEITGAVSTMSKEKMEISTAPSIVSRLQGQVSGVNITTANRPGGDATIRIRGTGTINDPNPLYVIDGVPVGPGNNLNPNDIESISILKDASSAAIYGSRGANGVVLITSKHGREGQKPSVNFAFKTGITNATNQYDMLNTQQYGEALWLQARNAGKTPGITDTSDPKYYSHPQYGSGSSPKIPDYILPAGAMEGAASVDPALYKYPDYVIFKANRAGTNWYDEIYRTGVIREYDLSVAGGGKNSTYALAANYLDEQGILKFTDFKRYTFRANADTRFNSWFKAGESLQVSYIDEKGNFDDNGEGTVVSFAYRSQPIIPVYDIKGNFAGSKAPGMGNTTNPVAILSRAQNNNGKYVRILGNIYGEADIMKGLTFKSLLGFNWGQWNYKGYNLATFESSEPNKIDGLNVDSNYSLQWNWTNTLNYNTTFAEVHKLNVVIGSEAIENKYQWLSASRSQYFSTTPLYMQLSSGEMNKDNSGSGSEWSLFSLFGRVNYDLMGKYYLEGTVRRDGSSRFSANKRYGTFPAASFAWALSQENFMAGTKGWLDLLKLRIGWGMAGNDRIGNYNMYSTFATNNYTAAYALSGSNTSASAGFEPSTKGNPDVTWETTKTLNVGVDATISKNLTLSVDAWQRNTSDMLYRLSVPDVMGLATSPYVNIGEMKNKGFDVELGYKNVALDGKLRYNLTATLSHYKNEITKLSDNAQEEIIPDQLRQMNYTRASVGTAFPEFYGYIVDGIFQTAAEAAAYAPFGSYNKVGHYKYRDISGPDGVPDGVIDPNYDMTYIGSPHPKFTGGLNIDLGYGNFDLNMFLYGSYGNKLINYVRRWIDYGMFNGGLSQDALYKSWGSPYLAGNAAAATLPALDQSDGSQQPSTAFVEDGSFLRLKTLRLGYTVPKRILDKAQIQNLRFYVQVTNLFTLTNYSGLDPELNSSGDQMGVDQGAWPTPRQIMFGVTIGL